jgi:hypothetical protein
MGAPQKKETTRSAKFAEGGHSNHMFGTGDRTTTAGSEQAGEQKPAGTAHDTSGGGGKFANGGSTKMFGYAGSVPAQSGITSAR